MDFPILTKEEIGSRVEALIADICETPGNVHNFVNLKFLDGGSGETCWVDFLFEAGPEHQNVFGIIHGGVSAILLDDGIGITGSVAMGKDYVTTSAMTLSYIHAMRGNKFRVHTELTHLGKRMISGTGEIYDENGTLCVTCMGNYNVFAYTKQ